MSLLLILNTSKMLMTHFIVNFEPVNFAGFIQNSNKDPGQVIDMGLVFFVITFRKFTTFY